MLHLPSLIRRPSSELTTLTGPISAFESETQAMMLKILPRRQYGITHVIVAMLTLAVILMAFAKLDRVVTSTGHIVTTQGSVFVQPFDRAIVKDIAVATGDIVTKGQVLAHLDPTFAAADLTRVTEKLQSDQALVERLTAERDGKPYEPVNPNPAQLLQESLWRQRQSEYQQNIAGFAAKISGAQSTIAGAQRDIELYGERLKHAKTIEEMHKTLEDRGYGSKLNSVLAEDSRTDISRLLAEAQSQELQARHTLDSANADRGVFIGKWQDDLSTALVTAQNDLSQTQGDMAKASKIHDLITLTAPEDAIVLKIGEASPGSVVSEGSTEPLFTLVPLNGALEAEVELNSQDIGFVLPGDHVNIKLDAYPYIRHGTISGTIKTISEGSFTVGLNKESRTPYFKARIQIDDTNLRSVPKTFRLVPGMTLSGDVIVGHRTMLSYLVEGGLRTGSEAMREP
jgi:HlyD family type I secretion membrane fusion protein